MKDYYRILEIHPDASLEVMNNAYRTLVRKYHPDLYHTTHKAAMQERMREINEAYETLSNSERRAQYDAALRNRPPVSPGHASPLTWPRVQKILLWGLGTFVFLRFLLIPMLHAPLGRLLILGMIFFLIIRLGHRTGA